MSESPFIACMWQVVRTPHRFEATAKMGSRMSSPPGCKPFRPDESEEQASELIPRSQEQECEDRREAEAQVSCRAGRAEPGASVCRTPKGGWCLEAAETLFSAGPPGGGSACPRLCPCSSAVSLRSPGARSSGLSTSSYTLAWERGLIRCLTQRELSVCRPSP